MSGLSKLSITSCIRLLLVWEFPQEPSRNKAPLSGQLQFADVTVVLRRYADFAGSTINDGFDYTYGKDLWKEKLAYTQSWLSAHISDADAIGKPLIVEEFGKAVSAKKVYTGELPHSLQAGEPSPEAECLWMPLAATQSFDMRPALCHWTVELRNWHNCMLLD